MRWSFTLQLKYHRGLNISIETQKFGPDRKVERFVQEPHAFWRKIIVSLHGSNDFTHILMEKQRKSLQPLGEYDRNGIRVLEGY